MFGALSLCWCQSAKVRKKGSDSLFVMLARLGLCVLMLTSAPLAVVVVHATNLPAMVQKAKPAVVEILTYDQQNKLLKTGTGFFISPDGELLTNYHVVSGGSLITAKMPNGAVFLLKSIVTASETYDVAKLQFFATDVAYLTLGSSSSAVEGRRVLVIGNPEGLEGTVSEGIISAFRENRSMIQITAPMSLGSSGSPVIDESGNVIGIATQIYREGQNLNFAISAETVGDAITQSSSQPSLLDPVTPSKNVARSPTADYVRRGQQKVGEGNFEGAIADYAEAIRINPNDAEAFNSRAFAYFSLKQYSKAVSDNTEAIRIEPDNSMTFAIRGATYLRLEEYSKAIADCNEAIRLIPINSFAYGVRGNAYYSLGQYSKAISDYTESIRILPGSFAVYESRANAYDKLGKSSEAAQDRKKAKELRDKH